MVRAHIATLRGAPSAAPPRSPTVRQVTGRLTVHPTATNEGDRVALKDVLTRCPGLEAAVGHVRGFGEMLGGRLGSTLPAWIDAVDAGRLPGLTGFALHLLRGLDAVTAGLTLDWNSGSIEGAVNRFHVGPRNVQHGERRPPVEPDGPAEERPVPAEIDLPERDLVTVDTSGCLWPSAGTAPAADFAPSLLSMRCMTWTSSPNMASSGAP